MNPLIVVYIAAIATTVTVLAWSLGETIASVLAVSPPLVDHAAPGSDSAPDPGATSQMRESS